MGAELFHADRQTRRQTDRHDEYINEIQQDATVRRYLFTAKLLSTFFGCPSHPSSGVHKTVTAASYTGHITYPGNNLPPAWPN